MWNQLEQLWSLIAPEQIPLWLKIGYTLFVCVLVPAYWKHYGPGNFLWFSDSALLITVIALWLENSLLASIAALAVLLLDFAWNLDFLAQLITGRSLTGLSAYMFNREVSRFIRALSLFHVFFPVLLVWLLYRLGYDGRALFVQTLLAWIALPLSYFFTRRSENVNWVHGFGNKPQLSVSPPLHILMLMILFPIVIYLPTHFLLQALF
ncbi:MAG TPA: hypothetical protein VJS64_05575 [Pyrinomonadaceae bacterium]|nr:hypothetical protein [Pyrinomonadaceae bacterium]